MHGRRGSHRGFKGTRIDAETGSIVNVVFKRGTRL